MTDPATLAWYEANAPRFTLRSDQAPSRDLDGFLDRLAPGAAILELGCGTGRDAARMAERGFAVDATDGSAAMVSKAKQRFGMAARRMRFDELNAVARYDAIWAHACLLHVARADLPRVLAAIRAALRPGGWHYASYKLGHGEGRDRLGRLHNFPEHKWLLATYLEAGFALAAHRVFAGEGADGTARDWMAITAAVGHAGN